MKFLFLILLQILNISGCIQNKLQQEVPKTIENNTVMNSNTQNEEQKILELTRKLTDLMITRDIEAMNKMVDKNFTLTHITGYVQPKEEWFKEIEAETMKYYGYEEVSKSVKINGDKAEFVGRNRLDARIWGSRNVWNLQQTMQLVKRNGEWIILNSVAKTF